MRTTFSCPTAAPGVAEASATPAKAARPTMRRVVLLMAMFSVVGGWNVGISGRMDGDRARGPHDDSTEALGRIIVHAAWRPGHPVIGRPSAYHGVTACWRRSALEAF